MKYFIAYLFTLIFPFLSSAQTSVDNYYHDAYQEIHAMLKDSASLNFERAVFLTENAYLDGKLDYYFFDREITRLSKLAKTYAKAIEQRVNYSYADRDTILIWQSIFKTLTDTLILSNYKDSNIRYHIPYVYDFKEHKAQKDWSDMFVSKLLATHKGNCHSLPYLYKMIANKLSVSTHFALAPNHLYIKHHSLKTGMYNTELTSATNPIDAWYISSAHIHLDAIRNGIYMATLDEKQSISLCLLDLAKGYERKYGYTNDTFILQCLETALKYDPYSINAMLFKAELIKRKYETSKGEKAKNVFSEYENLIVHIRKLGYRMPTDTTTEKSFNLISNQNHPFKSFDEENTRILTLSNGANDEFFDTDTLEIIGSAILNTKINKVIGFKITQEPEIISRWLSIDPLAAKYPYESPYIFTGNSPVLYVDADGREKVIHYVVTDNEGNTTQINQVNEDYIEYQTVYRNVGDNGYSFLSDIAHDFSNGNEPQAGYPEENVAHDLVITKAISLDDLQVVDADGNISLDFSKAKTVSTETIERKKDKTNFLDGFPGVTYYGSGDLDLTTDRKYSTLTDVTELVEIMKLLVSSTQRGVGRDDYTVTPDLGGALDLSDKAGSDGDAVTFFGKTKKVKVCTVCHDTLELDEQQGYHTDFDTLETPVK